jgi:hypothetical protein
MLTTWATASSPSSCSCRLYQSEKQWVAYGDGATRNDAERVRAALEKLGVFEQSPEIGMSLARKGELLVMRATYDKASIENGGAREWVTWAAEAISAALVPREFSR